MIYNLLEEHPQSMIQFQLELRSNKLNWRINNQIIAEKVRLLGPDGKQIGVVKLKKAIDQAKEEELDLVEIAPKAKPPVTKIVDLGKFRYEEEKKLKKQNKGKKSGELKEIRFSPFIGEADYQTRMERVDEFLKEGNKVRIVVKFKGRQMGSKNFGYKLVRKVIANYTDQINIDMEPKFIGRHLTCVISPMAKSKIKTKDKKLKNAKTKNKKNTD